MFPALVQEFGVLLVDVGGVPQHPVAAIDRGGGGVNRSGKAVADQRGQIAAMVHVGMRQDHRVDGGAGEGQLAILAVGVLAAALIAAANQHIPFAAGFQKVHGAGNAAGRAPERQLPLKTAMDMMVTSAKR